MHVLKVKKIPCDDLKDILKRREIRGCRYGSCRGRGQQATPCRCRTMSLASLRSDRTINFLIESTEAAGQDNHRADDVQTPWLGRSGCHLCVLHRQRLSTPSWTSGL